ncbi:RIO1 family-domain-containing protein [Lipomyces tetrasporus]|uniref:Serine/threonine-protein kinase RIO2 n=1 Tax=Lipomyces tetrasporus TaxID=54092 RepID=A0AAD7QZX5_9ASCO|nr:RIO1 family-domain-containing protein [Lipomyces tetrasporus]KAJ8102932.1 RIO1 family-domain-containing protein [Lipomyces tetrasporus]
MKLNTSAMRYLSNDDFRVLTATEMGSKNHEIVPTVLIAQIAGLRGGAGVGNCISELAKANLIARVKNAKYDGYRLTYGGYDYLAIKAFSNRRSVYSVGNQIGVGKESDIFVVANEKGRKCVLKIHRLGRISFRSVKNNRDYLRNRQSASWMYLSRLAAQKEFSFMKALYENEFAVPEPIDYSRHCIVMSLIPGFPMRQLSSHEDPSTLYSSLMSFIVRLANHGLIHCDFNEFNIMILDEPKSEDEQFVVIDFPQCVSIDHVDAERYFRRDVDCIRRFFEKKLGYVSEDYPEFKRDVKRVASLDIDVQASGFSKKMVKEFEKAISESREKVEDEFDHESFGEENYDDEEQHDDDEVVEEQEDELRSEDDLAGGSGDAEESGLPVVMYADK